MNILFFSTYYSPYLSGITTYPQKLLQHLSPKHHIQVVTFKHDHSLATNEVQDGINIHRLPYLFRISKGFISPSSIISFFKCARRADLIILNLPNVEALPLAIIASLFKKPILSIFHCRIDLGPGLINRFIASCANTSIYIQLRLSRHIVAYTKDYFCSLNWSASLGSKTSYILPPVEKLPVDQSYLNKLTKLKGNKVWIGFAGRIAQEKGLTFLIKALNQLKQSLPPAPVILEEAAKRACIGNSVKSDTINNPKTLANVNYHTELIFAGPKGKEVVGESTYYQQIIGQLQHYRIPHRFLGTLHQGKLGAFYQAIDILVLPSNNQTEAFGMVQVEAMLLGTPVIAADLPGVRIPIQLSHMGIIVPSQNTQELSHAIIQLIKHRPVYTHQKLITAINKTFNINKTFTAYDQLIDSLQ